jgi:hypothetical protein
MSICTFNYYGSCSHSSYQGLITDDKCDNCEHWINYDKTRMQMRKKELEEEIASNQIEIKALDLIIAKHQKSDNLRRKTNAVA